jgi:hypothetical protein
MNRDDLSLPSPLQVDLSEFSTLGDNSFRLWLRFEDGEFLALDFQPGSEGHEVILDVLGEVSDQRLRALGGHGILMAGMTEASEQQDEEHEES